MPLRFLRVTFTGLRIAAWLLSIFLLARCAQTEETNLETGSDSVLMAGLPAITGAALQLSELSHVMTGRSFGKSYPKRSSSFNEAAANERSATFSEAAATERSTSCGTSAATDACASGKKTATYPQCQTPTLNQTYDGSVYLQYSDSVSCSMNDQGENVTRTLSVNRNLFFSDFPRFNGTTLTTSSEAHTDYRSVEIGSGTKWTRVASSPDTFEIEILGLHKVLTNSKGRKVYDVSIRSTSAITVTGEVTTQSTLNGGTIELIHNTGQFVATFTPNNLIYEAASCCHPLSGTISLSFAGKVEGEGNLIFQSTCGRAVLERNGTQTALPLHGCE